MRSMMATVCSLFTTVAITMTAAGQEGVGPLPDAPPLEPNNGWLNTDRPLRIGEELKGHVVILDFWTYCCINCMHILPDLEYLEEKYADEPVVVIGVHSAKFEAEGEAERIRNAMLRYDIEHPVVVDLDIREPGAIWRKYGARSWPTFVVVDPEGKAFGMASGEGQRELLDQVVAALLDEHRERGTLAEERIEFELDHADPTDTGLRYPGKVLAAAPADGFEGRLFVADSSNDRVIVSSWPDDDGRSEVIDVYGDGERGLRDGGPIGSGPVARFNDPQGMAYDADAGVLYVADTRNHAVRAIDLSGRTVSTIAGTGRQGYDRAGGGTGTDQVISSPWALALDEPRGALYIAMAGPHQLWSMDLESGRVEAIAGSGRESITDGPAMEAALAQPSGLALSADGSSLYFADSEGSAIRALDLEARTVRTVIGVTTDEVFSPLFEFGDIDGAAPDARLQHVLGVTLFPTPEGERLLIADTYNDKLKLVDPENRTSVTWFGGMSESNTENAADRLLEPAGLHAAGGLVFVADTNNHRVVVVDPDGKRVRRVELTGLPPAD